MRCDLLGLGRLCFNGLVCLLGLFILVAGGVDDA